MCRLPEAERHIAGGSISDAQDQRCVGPAWKTTVPHNHGSHNGLLAGSSGAASLPHDRILHSMWIIPVYDDAIRTARSSSHIPATDG